MSQEYALNITGFDAVGNKTEQVIHFTVMQQAPSILIGPLDPLSNLAQIVSVSVAPSDAFVEIEIYKNGARVTGANVSYFTSTITEQSIYEVRVKAAKGLAEAHQMVQFEIDQTAPLIELNGVMPEQLYKEAVTIDYLATDGPSSQALSIEAKLTKNGEASILIPTPYTIDETGQYTLEVKATDRAGNTKTVVVHFKVEIPVVEEPYQPNTPEVNLTSVVTQTQTIVAGQKLVTFSNLNVSFDFGTVAGPVGSALTLKRYVPITPNGIMPIVTKKDTIHKLTSNIYKLTTSQPLNGEVTINLPYDASLVGKENKLEIACYDAVNDNWILVKGKFDKVTKTVSFKTNVLSYFMIVESIKIK